MRIDVHAHYWTEEHLDLPGDLLSMNCEGALVVSRAARRIDSFKNAIEALAEAIERESSSR